MVCSDFDAAFCRGAGQERQRGHCKGRWVLAQPLRTDAPRCKLFTLQMQTLHFTDANPSFLLQSHNQPSILQHLFLVLLSGAICLWAAAVTFVPRLAK